MKFAKLIATLFLTLFVAQAAFAQDGYRIKAGDTLTIEVLQDSALNRQAVVLPDGRISFPFAGTVRASGRTIPQVQEAISTAIASNFNAPPTVFVAVQPAPREPRIPAPIAPPAPPATIDIYFLGEVASPGPKELKPGVTVLQALSSSGGFTNFAATKRVQLRRTNPLTGVQTVYEINYDALANGAQIRNDVPLQDGDVLLVPERRLFE